MNWEFDTSSPEKVGTQTTANVIQSEDKIRWEDIFWSKNETKGETWCLTRRLADHQDVKGKVSFSERAYLEPGEP